MSRPDVVSYRGVLYGRYPDAAALSDRMYYRATTGDRAYLHRVVYTHVHGPIPPGYRVIHRDGDPANNTPANLVALPADPPPARRTLAQRRAAALALNDPTGYPATCEHCGETFTAHRRTAARYCSGAHRVAAFRARRSATTTPPQLPPS